MRELVSAVVTGLHRGRFIEDTLEALCVQLGAASAWSTLETRGGGPLHRSRTASFQGVAPAVLAMHVTDVLQQVQTKLRTVAGPVPYAPEGSFIAVPLWSQPESSTRGRSLVGALYLEFAKGQGTQPAIIEFAETVGALLGGMIAQQALIEDTREDLRVERARDHNEHYLTLDELLAPESMAEIRQELRSAIKGKASIMILGESGTGKTQLATAFARASNQEPIVRATLGMADDLNTITSELFGHERGSFSGAVSKRKGLVEYADGGTLILDEVLNLRGHAQQLLLDFAQFGSYRPLGYQGREPKTASIRIISVTNGDMQQAISDRKFRQDLYYRLATVPIVLPPLRERRWDIPNIAVRYLNRTDAEADWELDGGAMEALLSPRLDWHGNIRELEAVMERGRNRARANGSNEHVIEERHLDLGGDAILGDSRPPSARPSERPKEEGRAGVEERWQSLNDQRSELDALEKAIIEDALAACDGVVARTARMLDVPRTGLISRMATLEIEPERFNGRRGGAKIEN
ncbi:MAG: sigma 54-interacting transcriptional regulator [Myxococcales bacterium]|jgi:DNA-binding NtrC family response regulator